MSILADTNAVSELICKAPDPAVGDWTASRDLQDIFSPTARHIFERFKFADSIEKLDAATACSPWSRRWQMSILTRTGPGSETAWKENGVS